MPLFVTCQCGANSLVPDEYAGLRGRCPVCGRIRQIPKLGVASRPTQDVGPDAPPPAPIASAPSIVFDLPRARRH